MVYQMLRREELFVSKTDSYDGVRRNELWEVDAVGPWSIAIETKYVNTREFHHLDTTASVLTE